MIPWPGDEVHVWRISLLVDDAELNALSILLTPSEVRRARRLRVVSVARRLIAARGTLRRILACYLGCPPSAVKLHTASSGKPFIAGSIPLRFNLSHSGDLAVLGIALGREIGIDIEQIRSSVDVMGIAQKFFSPLEAQTLAALPEAQRVPAFYQSWIRKEALIKAMGGSISMLGEVHLNVMLSVWSLTCLDLEVGFAGILAVCGITPEIRYYEIRDWLSD